MFCSENKSFLNLASIFYALRTLHQKKKLSVHIFDEHLNKRVSNCSCALQPVLPGIIDHFICGVSRNPEKAYSLLTCALA